MKKTKQNVATLSYLVKKTPGVTGITEEDTVSLRKDVERLFSAEPKTLQCYLYEGALTASFSYGTGTNWECDDVIDPCLPFIEKALRGNINRCLCLRLTVNRNKDGKVAMLLSAEIAPKKVGSIVVMDDGKVYFLKEATHKPYLFVLENGNPLVTFASDEENGGYKGQQAVEKRGVFDGLHYVVSEKMTSSLPSRIGLNINRNDYETKFYLSRNGKFLFIEDGKVIDHCTFEKVNDILIPQITEV
jgi:hypothetical protein